MRINRKRLVSLVGGGALFYLIGNHLVIPTFLSNNPQYSYVGGLLLGWIVTGLVCIAALLVVTIVGFTLAIILSWLLED